MHSFIWSPICLPHVVLNPKVGFPYGHKMATNSYWGIYASSLMSTGRSTMSHNSRVHHSWNWINRSAKDTYKDLSTQFWRKWGEGFYTIKQFSDTIWVPTIQLNSDTIDLRQHQIPPVKSPISQACSSPTSDTSCKSRLSPALLTSNYRSEVLKTTSFLGFLGFFWFLPKWLTELKETFYSLDYRLIIKGYNSGIV